MLNQLLNHPITYFHDIPAILTDEGIERLFSRLKVAKICEGNNDFESIVNDKFAKGEKLCFWSADGEVRSFIEDDFLQKAC